MIPYSTIRTIIAYALIVFIIYLSSGGSPLTNDKNLMIGGWLFFTVAYLYFEGYIKPTFLILTSVFALLSGFYYFKNEAYNEVTYFGFFIKIYLAYYCRDFCKEDFFRYFVNVVFIGACISFPLFALQLINYDLLYNLNNFFGVEQAIEARSNSFLFTTLPLHQHRNCGFMWEPGAFAAVLVLTLYINLFKENEPLFSKKNSVLLIAILTTQSTMGFLALCIPLGLIVLDFMAQNKTLRQLSVAVVPILIAIFAFVFTKLDFLYSKISTEIAGIEEELAFVQKAQKESFLVATTRITSVILDMQTIRQYPVAGLGVDVRTVNADKIVAGEMTETACGITALMLRFGVLGLLVYVFLFYKKSFFTKPLHRFSWVLLLLVVLFSNELTESSFIHLFVF